VLTTLSTADGPSIPRFQKQLRMAYMNRVPGRNTESRPAVRSGRQILIPVLVLAGAGAALALLLRMPANSNEDPETQAPPVNVEVEVVAPLAELADTIELPGVVEANRVVEVSAEVEGRIERIAREEGQECQAGDPLIHINTDLLQADCDRAAAQADYDRSRYERISNLHKEGAATKGLRSPLAEPDSAERPSWPPSPAC
jgi:multidrug efflux pump subunit AcrA (membrane-fusion protein)